MKNISKYAVVCMAFVLGLVSCVKNKDGELVPVKRSTDIVVFKGESKSIEELIGDYVKAHPDENLDSAKITRIFNRFLAIINSDERFVNRKPSHIQPIYSYGVDGVAYYEIWFAGADKTLGGWVLISATDKDYPIVNYSHGVPYSSRLVDGSDGKVYRFGVSYYVLEKDGKKVSDYGQAPAYINNSLVDNGETGDADSKDPNSGLNNGKIQPQEGIDFFPVSDYEALKALFAKYYFTDSRKNTAKKMYSTFFSNEKGSKGLRTADAYQYRWVSGQIGLYTQIPANYRFNTFACWAGCNNNAWASLYSWWDRNLSKVNLIPTTSTGEVSALYRNTTARENVVDPVQMYCRSVSNTYCGSGTGWTKWSDSWRGYQYAPSRGYGWSYSYQWNNSAGANVNLANVVTDGIANNYRPVHIGANSHFYVGYGWAQWDTNTDWTWAYCYPGWSTSTVDDVWVSWHDFNASVRLFIY